MAWRIRESIAIGIDLGTTNSCVGVWRDNRVEIIANDQGNRTTPSYAAFRKNERFIGDAAKIEAIGNPANTVFDAKRLIGRRFSDPSVQSDKKLWPFKVIEGNADRPNIIVDYQGEEKKFTAEEISAMILAKLKEEAESFLGCTVKDAVVTVPAYFNDAQRQATEDAGAIAGLNVMRLMDEPTAAAVAYGFGINKVKSNRNVLVFDLGGGTLDVSLVKICKGVIEVKATAGDTHLGGEDFDNRLVLYMVAEVKRKQGKDVSSNPKALRRLKTACEQAKRSLSTTIQTVIDIDCLFEGIDFYSRITRARFEDLNTDLFMKCIETVARCHEESGIDKESIDAIVLAGGSTWIPKVQQLLRSYYSGKELCKSIHPDEAIACGAAIQAARLTGQGTKKMRNLVVTGVTPLSLGIELLGEIMDVIIPKNTPIPTKRSKVYSTTTEYQVGLDIRVYECERVLCKDNNLLGQFLLTFPPEPSGCETRVRISFKVDHDGILHVSAKELVSGWKNQLTMVNREGRLTKEEMNRMVWEGERNRIEDELFKKKCLAKNSLEENAYSLRKLVKDNHHIISKEKRVNYIAEAVSEIIGWMHDDVMKDVSEYDLKKREIVEMRIALCEFLP